MFNFRFLINAVAYFIHDPRVRSRGTATITFVGRDGRSYAVAELHRVRCDANRRLAYGERLAVLAMVCCRG